MAPGFDSLLLGRLFVDVVSLVDLVNYRRHLLVIHCALGVLFSDGDVLIIFVFVSVRREEDLVLSVALGHPLEDVVLDNLADVAVELELLNALVAPLEG